MPDLVRESYFEAWGLGAAGRHRANLVPPDAYDILDSDPVV
ncbi:MAG: hypothetical protein ABSB86_12770 [Bryobacteraceae bacterium]